MAVRDAISLGLHPAGRVPYAPRLPDGLTLNEVTDDDLKKDLESYAAIRDEFSRPEHAFKIMRQWNRNESICNRMTKVISGNIFRIESLVEGFIEFGLALDDGAYLLCGTTQDLDTYLNDGRNESSKNFCVTDKADELTVCAVRVARSSGTATQTLLLIAPKRTWWDQNEALGLTCTWSNTGFLGWRRVSWSSGPTNVLRAQTIRSWLPVLRENCLKIKVADKYWS